MRQLSKCQFKIYVFEQLYKNTLVAVKHIDCQCALADVLKKKTAFQKIRYYNWAGYTIKWKKEEKAVVPGISDSNIAIDPVENKVNRDVQGK